MQVLGYLSSEMPSLVGFLILWCCQRIPMFFSADTYVFFQFFMYSVALRQIISINFTNGIPTCSADLAMILFSAACSRDLPFGLQQLVI